MSAMGVLPSEGDFTGRGKGLILAEDPVRPQRKDDVSTSPSQTLAARLAAVEERLRAACARAGRDRAAVTLVAVTKTVPAAVAALLPSLGVRDLGESRPQELWRKAATLPGARWHLVGHLQRNKVERTLPLVHAIHSIDSLRLLEAVEAGCAAGLAGHRPLPVLLEVNASGEAAKHGFAPRDVPGLAPALAGLKHVRVDGLMGMAAYEDDPERCRPTFAALRGLRDHLKGLVGPAHPLDQLSMGMSNDFEVAVEEGATLVRLGTVLFEGLGEAP
jgi:pyridoxal phosphate enzyme (YggS family)